MFLATILFTILAASCDSLACGIAMGLRHIPLNRKTMFGISVFPLLIALISMGIAKPLLGFMTDETARFLVMALYFALAIYSFAVSRRNDGMDWMDPNQDQRITGWEIVSVGLALSLDTLVVGLPLAFLGYPVWLCAVLFGIFSAELLWLGHKVSRHAVFAKRNAGSLAWVIYAVLGICRLF